MMLRFRSAQMQQGRRCLSVLPSNSWVSQRQQSHLLQSESTTRSKFWLTNNLQCSIVNQYLRRYKYGLLFCWQGSVRYKSDNNASVVSTLPNEKITATPLYREVKDFIESWVESLDGKTPTQAQDEELRNFICDLDDCVKNEKIKFGKNVTDVQVNDGKSDPPQNMTSNADTPTSLKQLIHYILDSFDDEQLKELEFAVLLREWPTFLFKLLQSHNIFFKSRVEFQTALKCVEDHHIEAVSLGDAYYRSEAILKAFANIQSLLCSPADLVKRINRLSWTAQETTPKYSEILPWEEKLVQATGDNDFLRVSFCLDFSKGSALIVSGECGSGKTWFCQKYIPNKLGQQQDLALFYYSLDDNDGHNMIKSDEILKIHKTACENGMRYLQDAKRISVSDYDVFQCLRKLTKDYSQYSEHMAYDWLKTQMSKIFDQDVVVQNWWNSKVKQVEPIGKLVIVVDDIGKNPELARGLVRIVRTLYGEIIRDNKAKQVLLVLAGSGLERHFWNATVPYFEAVERQTTVASWGTDPNKAQIIVLKGPDLTLEQIGNISTKSLLRGTYARVLATNTRMLTRGVIPMMKFPGLINQGEMNNIPERYEMLGSANVVMDYAVRTYTAQNGLSKLDDHDLERLVLTQFKILLHASLASIKDSNPASIRISEDLHVKIPKDFDEVLRLGLVTTDVKSTSPALRYLACNGMTAPLGAQDGIGFEIMVQHHLVRLCEAYNRNYHIRHHDSGSGAHWIGQFNLRQPWPPTPCNVDDMLTDRVVTKDEVEEQYRYSHLGHPDFDDTNDDVDDIMDLLQDKVNFDLVLRQTVSNAQGPDIMILSRKDGNAVLHLFQCKHVKRIPGMEANELLDYFRPLGVKMDKGGANICVEPTSGIAGYSYHGIDYFAKKLTEKLETPVKIGHRIVVFSEAWDGEWDTVFLQEAMDKGVMVWTREMLEPTISALSPMPTTTNQWSLA